MTFPITPNEAITVDAPDDSPMPWPVDDDAIITHVQKRRKRAEDHLGEWYDEAKIDFRFAEGKQWEDTDIIKLEAENRVAATFNRCAPIVNAVLGQEVSNRQEVRYLPRRVDLNVGAGADLMNDAVKWAREQCNAEDEDSDAFADMTTCGMGWTCSSMEYEYSPEGKLKVERRDPMLMRWDVSARRRNIVDKKWVQADYWMTKEAIEERWPDADIEAMVQITGPDDRQQPHDSTEAWKYQNKAAGQDRYNDELRAIHHVERFMVSKYRMIDPATQTMREYSEGQYKTLKENAKEAGVDLPKAVPTKKCVYWEAWTVGSVVLAKGEAEMQTDFCYQAMTCYRERETGYWYGVIRMMRDPQRYANRLMSLMMSILATGAKGGLLYEAGAFANPKVAKRDWAKHDSAIEVNPGKLDAIRPKDQMKMPEGAAELMQFAITSIRDVTGVNVDMLGGADRDQPGVVEDMRTKAGLTILARIFDAMRLYRKNQGAVLAEFVQRFMSDGRLIRVVGKTGEQFIPLIRDPQTLEYDIVVDESPSSRDVKERAWGAIQVMAPMALQAQMPLPPSLLDYAPIPASLAMEWKQAILKKEQEGPQPNPLVQAEQIKGQTQQQLAQMKMQSEQQMAQAKGQYETQIETLKLQKQAAVEQAQAQADMQVQQQKAALDYQLSEAKLKYEMQLEMFKHEMQLKADLQIEQIRAQNKIEVAQIAANAAMHRQLQQPQVVN